MGAKLGQYILQTQFNKILKIQWGDGGWTTIIPPPLGTPVLPCSIGYVAYVGWRIAIVANSKLVSIAEAIEMQA